MSLNRMAESMTEPLIEPNSFNRTQSTSQSSNDVKIKSVIIAGSGPVGSFMAVLCANIGFPVTVYEKREEFTRSINLKIEDGFFREVQNVLHRLNAKTNFFENLDELLKTQNNKILIKELEERFARKAKSLGAKYITREVQSFDELYIEHKASDPVILDCTGKNSQLRIGKFGPDRSNIVNVPLQHAMYINFKAKITEKVPSLYQVMKYVGNIKLTEVIVSNCDDDGFSDVTIPIFIDGKLACAFDNEYPDINKNPINPFNCTTPVSDTIFFPISSVVGNLILDGYRIDLNSIKVKKIEINCGYALKRSENNCVCLGDSAIYLAYFRSLNLGLKHALEFFTKLSMLQPYTKVMTDDEIIKQFQENYPHLNAIGVLPTEANNVYLVITKVIWYGCFSYCLTNQKMERLTFFTGVYRHQIGDIHEKLNEKLKTWKNSLDDFEAKREQDISNEIYSNKTKNVLYNSLSLLIDINGQSFIKISELMRAAEGKYALYSKDFKFLLDCFKIRRWSLANGKINIIRNLLSFSDDKRFEQMKKICARSDLSDEKKVEAISAEACFCFGFRGRRKGTWVQNSTNKNVKSDFILAVVTNEIIQRASEPSSVDTTSLGRDARAIATRNSNW